MVQPLAYDCSPYWVVASCSALVAVCKYIAHACSLNHVDEGGETLFPAADGAMAPDEALRLDEAAARRVGLAVRPSRGSALLFYNHGPDGRAIDPAAVHAGSAVLRGEKWGANHWVSWKP